MPKRKKTTVRRAAPRKSAVKKAGAARKKTPLKKTKTHAKPAQKKQTTPRGSGKTARKAVSAIPGKIIPIGRRMKHAAAPEVRREKFVPYKLKQGEEYMGPAQVEHFRNILLKWKQDLMEEVDRTVHHMRDEAANFPDPNDRATQEEEFALELRTRDRERKLIKKIDESLLALERGDYGYCEICGIEIGVRRLEARPAATLCIDCKTLDEIKEKHMG